MVYLVKICSIFKSWGVYYYLIQHLCYNLFQLWKNSWLYRFSAAKKSKKHWHILRCSTCSTRSQYLPGFSYGNKEDWWYETGSQCCDAILSIWRRLENKIFYKYSSSVNHHDSLQKNKIQNILYQKNKKEFPFACWFCRITSITF